MDDKDFIILQHLHKEKNITRIAEKLYISQPALTYRLRQIESEFEIQLFIRQGRNVDFTPEGAHLAAFAKDYNTRFVQVKEELKNMKNNVQGTVRLGATNNYARFTLPPLLKKLTDLFPLLKFNIITGSSTDIVQMLDDYSVHLGVVRGDFKTNMVKNILNSERIALIKSPEDSHLDLIEMGEIQNFTTLRQHQNSKRIESSSFFEVVRRWWERHYDLPSNVTMLVDSYNTCTEMVKNQLGYAFVPEVYIKNDNELDVQYLRNVDQSFVTRDNVLLHHKDTVQLKAVETVKDYMLKNE